MGAEKDLTVSMLRKQWVNELQLAREIRDVIKACGSGIVPFLGKGV